MPSNSASKNSKIAHFNTGVTLVYITSSFARYTYSAENVESSREYFSCSEEAYLTLSHFGGYLMNSKSSEANNKNLISPCRLSLDYKLDKKQGSNDTNINISVRIESICMIIGFRDIEFFKTLSENWASLSSLSSSSSKQPVPVKATVEKTTIAMTLDGDAVQITVINDTGLKSASLLHIQFSNVGLAFGQETNKRALRVEILMFIDYFNKNFGAWEPGLED